jgi:hypothetical protein
LVSLIAILTLVRVVVPCSQGAEVIALLRRWCFADQFVQVSIRPWGAGPRFRTFLHLLRAVLVFLPAVSCTSLLSLLRLKN